MNFVLIFVLAFVCFKIKRIGTLDHASESGRSWATKSSTYLSSHLNFVRRHSSPKIALSNLPSGTATRAAMSNSEVDEIASLSSPLPSSKEHAPACVDTSSAALHRSYNVLNPLLRGDLMETK